MNNGAVLYGASPVKKFFAGEAGIVRVGYNNALAMVPQGFDGIYERRRIAFIPDVVRTAVPKVMRGKRELRNSDHAS